MTPILDKFYSLSHIESLVNRKTPSCLEHEPLRLSEAGTDPKRIIAIGEAGIGSYESCRKEYIDMGKELAGLSDKHNGLIAQCK